MCQIFFIKVMPSGDWHNLINSLMRSFLEQGFSDEQITNVKMFDNWNIEINAVSEYDK